jgi:hypothetical protein
MRFHRAWAAKNVAKRIETAAAEALAALQRQGFSSHDEQ